MTPSQFCYMLASTESNSITCVLSWGIVLD